MHTYTYECIDVCIYTDRYKIWSTFSLYDNIIKYSIYVQGVLDHPFTPITVMGVIFIEN